MLEASGLTTKYGAIAALRNASVHVGSGEVVGLIGPNGAGKTTLLNTIAGLLAPTSGSVLLDGFDVTGHPPERLLRSGLALVPEHRRIFTDLTVEENLKIGGVTVSSSERTGLLDEMREQFPVLAEKWTTPAGYLSGGEAQQLAIARALMSKPRLLMMDEPSLGLAPIIVESMAEVIKDIHAQGTSILLVEQNAMVALRMADRAYVLEAGNIVREGPSKDLLADDYVKQAYLGGSVKRRKRVSHGR